MSLPRDFKQPQFRRTWGTPPKRRRAHAEILKTFSDATPRSYNPKHEDPGNMGRAMLYASSID